MTLVGNTAHCDAEGCSTNMALDVGRMQPGAGIETQVRRFVAASDWTTRPAADGGGTDGLIDLCPAHSAGT